MRRLLTIHLAALLMGASLGASDGANPMQPRAGAQYRRAFSEAEATAIWERRAPRNVAHRGYIFIDEEDIIEGVALPLYTIEASRYGALRQLERMVGGDAGQVERIAELDPVLARETVAYSRSERGFFSRRPGGRDDVPETPDLLSPLIQFVRNRR